MYPTTGFTQELSADEKRANEIAAIKAILVDYPNNNYWLFRLRSLEHPIEQAHRIEQPTEREAQEAELKQAARDSFISDEPTFDTYSAILTRDIAGLNAYSGFTDWHLDYMGRAKSEGWTKKLRNTWSSR